MLLDPDSLLIVTLTHFMLTVISCDLSMSVNATTIMPKNIPTQRNFRDSNNIYYFVTHQRRTEQQQQTQTHLEEVLLASKNVYRSTSSNTICAWCWVNRTLLGWYYSLLWFSQSFCFYLQLSVVHQYISTRYYALRHGLCLEKKSLILWTLKGNFTENLPPFLPPIFSCLHLCDPPYE